MTRLRAILPALLLGAAPPAPEAGAERAFEAFVAAARAGDRAALDRLTDPAFVQHHGYGLTVDRADWLAEQGLAPAAAATAYVEIGPSLRAAGDDVALRTAFVRLRRPERGIDSWTRSDAVLVRRGGAWRVADLATAILWEGPISDAPADAGLAGEYRTDKGESWRVAQAGGLWRLSARPGSFVPLFPIGPGRMSAGFGSTLRTIAEEGRIVAIERWYGDRLAWRAARR